MRVEDKVIYKNDKIKIVYIIEKIENNNVYIKGINYRIYRMVNIDDIEEATMNDIMLDEENSQKYYNKVINTKKREKRRYLLGKILHFDGDERYLNKCLELYEALGISANGVKLDEKDMPKKIDYYIDKLNPDIVVITGHDLYNNLGKKNLDSYSNTIYFIETIKKIRLRKSSYECSIIAGACQSNFEALIASGADFASSPKRINVHTYDPAVLAIKVATTSFLNIVDINEALKYIENGKDAYSGVETLGKMKLLY